MVLRAISDMRLFYCYLNEKQMGKMENTTENLTKSRFQNRTIKTKKSFGLKKNVNSIP